jgi:hypothetical protein
LAAETRGSRVDFSEIKLILACENGSFLILANRLRTARGVRESRKKLATLLGDFQVWANLVNLESPIRGAP